MATLARERLAPSPQTSDEPSWTALLRVFEFRVLEYRRTFRASIFASFISPALFLTAMGLGLGGYVNGATSQSFEGGTYLAFLAPGLLAAALMQTAAGESMFPILGGLQWQRTYHAMYATPIRPRDICLGILLWITTRLTLVGSVFLLVTFLFGAIQSPMAIFAIPAGVLTGMAFAAPISAFAATQRRPDMFSNIFRFGVTPLFLLSGTFFPIESLPNWLQPLAWLSPLWHGVSLCRGFMLGTIGDDPLMAVVHFVVLITIVIVGTWAGLRTFHRRLVAG
ncbi:MAG TPA: ABC transporter permease [Candidatus Limnocylindrales bacterium]|jgi:lipooligosaccharide transport system permease protein